VALRSYALSDTYIVGYGRPDYENKAESISRRTHEDQSAGYYVVSYDFLNVRATRSASAAKKGKLDKGELVRVSEVKNGWGKIEYKSATAYISLEYADFVTPSTHKISYMSEGKTLFSREFRSTDAPVVASFTPEREGYEFLGWEDATRVPYASGTPLPAAELSLAAVWRELPVTEEAEGENGENEGNMQNGMENSVPSPEMPPLSLPSAGTRDFTLASRIASAVTGVLGLLALAAWYAWRRKAK
jgi:hypothetical protein